MLLWAPGRYWAAKEKLKRAAAPSNLRYSCMMHGTLDVRVVRICTTAWLSEWKRM